MATVANFDVQLRSKLSRTGLFPRRYCVDLGSEFLKVLFQERSFEVYPDCYVRHRSQGDLVKFGRDAFQMMGKLPSQFELVWPIVQGHSQDTQQVLQMMQMLCEQMEEKIFLVQKVLPRQFLLIVSPSVSLLERRSLQVIGHHLFGITNLVSSSEALLAQWQQLFPQQSASLLIDVGSAKTELVVVARRQILKTKTVAIGGRNMTQSLQRAVRTHYHLQLGWAAAEKVKKELIHLGQNESKKMLVMRGQDVLTGLPTALEVRSDVITPEVERVCSELAQEIQQLLHDLPPEVVTELSEQSAYLTGGGSQLLGLSSFLSQRLKIDITRAKDPTGDTCRGGACLLKH